MSLYKNILIPVDFSVNTEVAVKKALDLSEHSCTTIELVHVVAPEFISRMRAWFRLARRPSKVRAEKQLKEWKQSIEDSFPDLEVSTLLLQGYPVQRTLVKRARQLRPDLIVIGKQSAQASFRFRSSMISALLARRTGCTVLTVKPGAMYHKIKTLVVPLSQNTSGEQMELMRAFALRSNLKVHLVGFAGKEMRRGQPPNFLKIYQWLKSSSRCQVECKILPQNNRSNAMVDYAAKVNADLLLMNPGFGDRNGWLEQDLSDRLPRASPLQVLWTRKEIVNH